LIPPALIDLGRLLGRRSLPALLVLWRLPGGRLLSTRGGARHRSASAVLPLLAASALLGARACALPALAAPVLRIRRHRCQAQSRRDCGGGVYEFGAHLRLLRPASFTCSKVTPSRCATVNLSVRNRDANLECTKRQ
jgi:hypothetical protein